MSKIQVNEIVNHFDTGAPDCPKGLTVTGFTTFSGGVSIGGTLTYEDVTNIDSVGIITAQSGIHVLGSGNLVGIGTTNPESRLHVYGTHNSHIRMTNTSNDALDLVGDANRSGQDSNIFSIKSRWNGTDVARISFKTGSDTTDKDDAGITFHTKDSGASIAERLRIDSKGRVGINTTGFADTATALNIKNGATGSDHTFLDIECNTNETCRVRFSEDGSTYPGEIRYNTQHNRLEFHANSNERMRITSAGDVQVKEYDPRIGAAFSAGSGNFTSYFAATGSGTGNIPMIIERHSDDGVAIEFKRNTSVVGNINVTSTTTNYVTSSDYRLKENVVDLDGAITRVKQLSPKRFNFIVDAATTVDGFLAHEAQAVVPEAVTGSKDGVDDDGNAVMQGIDQSKLVPLLTAALKEAISEIETLKTKVAALEGN